MTSRPDSTSSTTRQELTQLAITDSLSEFRSVDRYKGDSLLLKFGHGDIHSPTIPQALSEVDHLPRFIFKGVVIKDLKAPTCYYYGMIDKVLYYYKDTDYPVRWQLLPDTARVSGYTCQKAVTKLEGRIYTAWFTRQLPLSNGPYKFGGLPGLIVAVSDATNSYRFELVKLYQPRQPLTLALPSSVIYYKQPGKLVAKLDYYRSYYDYETNFFGRATTSGMTKFDNENSLRQTYQEKLKHRNNPLELAYKKALSR